MNSELQGLPIRILQVTSDEGSGLVSFIKSSLGAHHSPDLFHAQYEITKVASASLNADIRRAENDDAKEQAQKQKQSMSEAIHTLSNAYHLFDPATGQMRTPRQVTSEMTAAMKKARDVVKNAELSDRVLVAIDKVERLIPRFAQTLGFVVAQVKAHVDALFLSPELHHEMMHNVLPALYLKSVRSKTVGVDKKKALETTIDSLIEPLKAPHAEWKNLPDTLRRDFEQSAERCIELFQRSSSSVEGRNGQLSLRHHSLHRLTDSKLRTLTIIHNYFIQRPDGTTAAERFFGQKPRDLFDFLVDTVSLPHWPRNPRPHVSETSLLN
jgi:hypothetical protein